MEKLKEEATSLVTWLCTDRQTASMTAADVAADIDYAVSDIMREGRQASYRFASHGVESAIGMHESYELAAQVMVVEMDAVAAALAKEYQGSNEIRWGEFEDDIIEQVRNCPGELARRIGSYGLDTPVADACMQRLMELEVERLSRVQAEAVSRLSALRAKTARREEARAAMADRAHTAERTVETAPAAARPRAKTAVDGFREKTEMFFDRRTDGGVELDAPHVYEDLAKEIVESIDGIEAVDAIVSGSRSRGLSDAGSDLDIVVEYRGDMKEHAVYNIVADEIASRTGLPVAVDINPIRAEETGTLEEHVERIEGYLDEKAREQAAKAAEKAKTPAKRAKRAVKEQMSLEALQMTESAPQRGAKDTRRR